MCAFCTGELFVREKRKKLTLECSDCDFKEAYDWESGQALREVAETDRLLEALRKSVGEKDKVIFTIRREVERLRDQARHGDRLADLKRRLDRVTRERDELRRGGPRWRQDAGLGLGRSSSKPDDPELLKRILMLVHPDKHERNGGKIDATELTQELLKLRRRK